MHTVVIPMKGSNERCPGKNIRSLGGKPLCAWLLQAVNEAYKVDKVIVDTDDKEIAATVNLLADKYLWEKTEISMRPEAYCGPLVGGNQLLERFVQSDGSYMQAHVTSPFLSSKLINTVFEALDDAIYPGCVFGVTGVRQRVWAADVQPVNFDPYAPMQRTQDMEPVYHENGSFFAFHGEYYMRHGYRRNTDVNARMLELKFPETVDIDTEEDFKLAECVIQGDLV